MSIEYIEQEIKKLEEQRKALEFDFHRLTGAIIALGQMKERMMQPKAGEVEEVESGILLEDTSEQE